MPAATLTRRQASLLDAFEASRKPLSAQEAWAAAGGAQAMGLATVYRAIHRLEEMGRLRPVRLVDAPPLWECADRPRASFFYCTHCREVFEAPAPDRDPEAPEGFRVRLSHVALYGECARCSGS